MCEAVEKRKNGPWVDFCETRIHKPLKPGERPPWWEFHEGNSVTCGWRRRLQHSSDPPEDGQPDGSQDDKSRIINIRLAVPLTLCSRVIGAKGRVLRKLRVSFSLSLPHE